MRRKKSSSRDFNDPKYVVWRKAVRKRDRAKCVICGTGKRIQVHHIKRWADYPDLRYDVNNGCCLCYAHHKQMWNKESLYEGMLSDAILGKTKSKIKGLLDEYGI